MIIGVLCGCSKNKSEEPKQEKVTVESLQAQVDELTQKVNGMQETIDRYYAGSVEAEQEPSYSLDDITYETFGYQDRALTIVSNNGTEPVVGLKVLATFYDAQNNMLFAKESYVDITNTNAKAVAEFDFTAQDLGQAGNYDHIEVQLSKEPYSFVRTFISADNFEVSSDKDQDGTIMVKVTNNGEYMTEVVEVTAVFYQNGEVIGYNTNSMINIQPGQYDTKKLFGPYEYNNDGTGQSVAYDNYEIFLSSTYNY